MPDEYRAKLIKFIEMHGNSELMGVLPEREWILRAPTLQRKLALTAKVQDEVGHAQLIYRVVEDLGKPRERCLEDLVSGKAKFHNVFHYPTKTWGDVGVIAWLVDAAAIISQKALLKCSYAPYARIMKKICWEESFHILHGRDVILTMMNGTDEQRELVQEARDALVGAADDVPRQPDRGGRRPDGRWRIKSQGNEEARQQFLDGYVPQIWELGLTVPDPKLRKRDDGVWEYTEPDWDELRRVVTGHGPRTAERLEFRRGFARADRVGARRSCRRGSVIFEVFRQERRGQAFQHAGSIAAPDEAFAEPYAREQYGRRRVGGALGRAARGDPQVEEFADELKRNYHRVDGYPLKEKLKEARERAGTAARSELADDELILGWRDSEWTGIAPSLEEDVAFSSIAQNEIGHARALYELAARDLGTTADELAFDRDPTSTAARRSSSCGCCDWARTIARHLLYEMADEVRVEALKASDDPEVAGLAAKIDREEAYHRMHARCGSSGCAASERFEAAVASCGRTRWACSPRQRARSAPRSVGREPRPTPCERGSTRTSCASCGRR